MSESFKNRVSGVVGLGLDYNICVRGVVAVLLSVPREKVIARREKSIPDMDDVRWSLFVVRWIDERVITVGGSI